ncbi:JAB domain-containing protein [Roseiconus lacunae]|uniref:JAB domain-containing protein n=1 Tax=Roseiconus lacunae TaxID=2605694 RepID=UPI003087C86A|nr:JAB domain-containing protein [Stieleria sp. HD01]
MTAPSVAGKVGIGKGIREMLMEIKHEFTKVTAPETFAAVLGDVFAVQHEFDRAKEQLFVVGLNTKHAIRYLDLVSMGTIDASLVHPREVFRHAVNFGVAKIAVAHNHPSGDLQPSREDIAVTKQLIKAGSILGIPLMDHLIVSMNAGDFLSLRSEHPELGWTA